MKIFEYIRDELDNYNKLASKEIFDGLDNDNLNHNGHIKLFINRIRVIIKTIPIFLSKKQIKIFKKKL